MTGSLYERARRQSVWQERRRHRVVRVAGSQRLDWLQGLLTNDVAALSGGGACYAAWLTPQGRMITDADVIETGEMTWLDVPAPIAADLASRLDSMIFAEDVQISLGDELSLLAIVGPQTPTVLTSLLGRPLPSEIVRPYRVEQLDAKGTGVLVVGSDALGVPGVHLYAPASAAGPIRDALRAAGVPEIDDETAEVLRVEAGRPRFLEDMGDDTIPLEAGIEGRAISYEKGCYVGQEIIIRMRDRGHGRVARKLVGLIVEGTTVPNAGDGVIVDGRQVGRVTSAVMSVALDSPVALGYVHRDYLAEGTPLEISAGATSLPARVSSLPFVD
jgi:folate-binding protein YgfZ